MLGWKWGEHRYQQLTLAISRFYSRTWIKPENTSESNIWHLNLLQFFSLKLSAIQNKHYANNRKHNVILSRGTSCILISLWVVLQSGNIGCLLSNENWARVKVKFKRMVISYTRPLSTIAIIARRTFCFLASGRICSFRQLPDSYFVLQYLIRFVLNCRAVPTGSLLWILLVF